MIIYTLLSSLLAELYFLPLLALGSSVNVNPAIDSSVGEENNDDDNNNNDNNYADDDDNERLAGKRKNVFPYDYTKVTSTTSSPTPTDNTELDEKSSSLKLPMNPPRSRRFSGRNQLVKNIILSYTTSYTTTIDISNTLSDLLTPLYIHSVSQVDVGGDVGVVMLGLAGVAAWRGGVCGWKYFKG